MTIASEKANASQYGKIYYARHMIPGLCGYDDETVLINASTMKRMAPSFEGKPIYAYAHDSRSEAERVATLQETSHGYVTETFYNELDGWLWSKCLIVDDEGLAAIADGCSVSNAYIPLEYGEGGLNNNIPYDREIVDAKFTHLALVDNPRYEQACIMTPDEFKIYQDRNREQLNELRNSKTEKKGNIMLKMFKTKKEEVSSVDADTLIEVTNSKGETKEVSVQEMVNALEAAEKKKADEKKNSQTVKVGGKDITIEELVSSYEKLNAKKNSDDADADDEKDNESDEDEKDNESDEDEKDNEGEDDDKGEAKNSKGRKADHFDELSNARNKSRAGSPTRLETTQSKIARGKAKYGAPSQTQH